MTSGDDIKPEKFLNPLSLFYVSIVISLELTTWHSILKSAHQVKCNSQSSGQSVGLICAQSKRDKALARQAPKFRNKGRTYRGWKTNIFSRDIIHYYMLNFIRKIWFPRDSLSWNNKKMITFLLCFFELFLKLFLCHSPTKIS